MYVQIFFFSMRINLVHSVTSSGFLRNKALIYFGNVILLLILLFRSPNARNLSNFNPPKKAS